MIVLPNGTRIGRTPVFNFFLWIVPMLVPFFSCKLPSDNSPKKFRIGFSQCTGDSKWRKATLDGAGKEMIFHPGSELIYRNAEDNSQQQVQQIRELGNSNIDILLVSPNEAEPLTSVVEEIYHKGIPVVILDRRIASDKYTAFVGADNVGIGRMAGNYVSNLYHPGRRIIEIIGLKGSTPSLERKRGFDQTLKGISGADRPIQLHGDWLLNKASDELYKIKDKLRSNDIIFAQNDPMALGAYEVYRKLGLEKTASFVGVDGLTGNGGGIEMVDKHILKATLLNPTGAEEAVQLAFKILTNAPYDRENLLSTVVIDSSNVRIMKLQTDKINAQQRDIGNQQEVLLRQQKMYEDQSILVNVVVAVLLLVVTLGSIAVHALWRNKKITHRLALQNQEILTQRNQLIDMTAKAREATDAKFNFFTNISHEFRTPLTLILGPVEETLASPKLHHTLRDSQQLVHKNATRLLRLINQLMDYRKVEEGRMVLRVTENDLVAFVNEIADAFQVLSKQKSISLKVNCKQKSLPAWFDLNMMDKVLFNLLSNAFKFTSGHGGFIYLSVGTDHNMAFIQVEDSGVGMYPEEAQHAFDTFYQGSTDNTKGTGLGLSLSKALVELHHGKIELSTEKWKGTRFRVLLPLGKDHFTEKDYAGTIPVDHTEQNNEAKIFTEELEDITPSVPDTFSTEKFHSILIIEDNEDLRYFLKSKLQVDYDVYEAGDGNAGIDLAFDMIPDLIISDIILPGRDGLQVSGILKQDIRTAHIPLILLTAKGSIEEQIQGIRTQADAFIVKPFNVEYLTETIRTLLKSRSVLRDRYTSEFPSASRAGVLKKVDRKFVNELTALVERNIANEHLTIDEIGREMGISRIQLTKKVKALVGCNVPEFVLTARLQRARLLLASTEHSVFEIACNVGFSSQAYFSTVFKSKFSITPTEYRENKSTRQ